MMKNEIEMEKEKLLHYNQSQLLFIRQEDVVKAIGKPIYFKKGGVEEEGVIEKVLLNDPQVRALCPRPELVDLFVGILVRLKNGEEKRLKIGDSTIDYVAFRKEEK